MPTHRRCARPRYSKPSLHLAENTICLFLPWSAAHITIRFSCRRSLPPPCCLSPAAAVTVIAPTNMLRRKISRGEHWCWQRLWQHFQVKPIVGMNSKRCKCRRKTMDQRLGSICFANLCVARLDDRVNEVAALVIRQEGTLHRIDRDLFEIIQ